uniref:Uncharacterized protein n=1 Tax=Amorphochlora amoebiformis TaxID=1561963 RepID=A0A6T6VKF3_9EUKA|mmetsp:Transcript_25816/g.40870  ORF Transcript_25816/g.40870 Transcript_25816/m.40870 type:complete len:229 (+) Transcript_25816:880-1566(+)
MEDKLIGRREGNRKGKAKDVSAEEEGLKNDDQPELTSHEEETASLPVGVAQEGKTETGRETGVLQLAATEEKTETGVPQAVASEETIVRKVALEEKTAPPTAAAPELAEEKIFPQVSATQPAAASEDKTLQHTTAPLDVATPDEKTVPPATAASEKKCVAPLALDETPPTAAAPEKIVKPNEARSEENEKLAGSRCQEQEGKEIKKKIETSAIEEQSPVDPGALSSAS